MKRKRIKRNRGGNEISRATIAAWLKTVRHTVRRYGNRIERVWAGVSYVVRDGNGRGIASHIFNPITGKLECEDIK